MRSLRHGVGILIERELTRDRRILLPEHKRRNCKTCHRTRMHSEFHGLSFAVRTSTWPAAVMTAANLFPFSGIRTGIVSPLLPEADAMPSREREAEPSETVITTLAP